MAELTKGNAGLLLELDQGQIMGLTGMELEWRNTMARNRFGTGA